MTPSNKILADYIDVMVAFQNKKPIQFRSKNTSRPWKRGINLSFNFVRYEYRLEPPAPPEPREGYIFRNQLHKHPSSHKHRVGEGTCFRVREVLEGDE